jgi:hypothetical protein
VLVAEGLVFSPHSIGAQSKTFFRWMNNKGWVRRPDALDGIEVLGRRKKGKPQLTEDESKSLLDLAVRLGQTGDEGTIATATALLLGLHAGEIVGAHRPGLRRGRHETAHHILEDRGGSSHDEGAPGPSGAPEDPGQGQAVKRLPV